MVGYPAKTFELWNYGIMVKNILKKSLYSGCKMIYNRLRYKKYAEVVELADALRSGRSVRKDVRVQIPPSAPKKQINALVH